MQTLSLLLCCLAAGAAPAQDASSGPPLLFSFAERLRLPTTAGWLLPARQAGPPTSNSAPQPVGSAPAELITDRPDQTESAVTVAPGFVQVETGWAFAHDDTAGERHQTHTLPGTLVRIGVADRVELRAGWRGYIREEQRGIGGRAAITHGAGDGELSAKIQLHPEQGALPQVALIAGASLPLGEADISSRRVDPSFRFSLAHTLSDRFALGYNLGMVWNTAADDAGHRATLANYLYTLSLGIGLSERLDSFIEVFGEVGASAPGPPAHALDGGFTYLLRPNLQLDLSGGVGLSRQAEDWFLGLGVSFRLPR